MSAPGRAGPAPRLDARAAQRFVRDLHERGDLRAPVAGADLLGEPAALREACQRVRDSARPGNDTFEAFDRELFALGSTLWLYDDDGVHGRLEPDPLLEALDAWLARQRPTRIHLQVFGALHPVLERLRAHRALEAVSHLVVAGARALEATPRPPPGLLALSGAADALAPWLAAAPPPGLEALTLLRGGTAHACLDALGALRHLGLWFASPDEMAALLAHPIVARLETLDLFAIETARHFPFARLLERRDELGHLRRLFVPGHLVPEATRARFADWPQVRFVSYDRLEALGYDLMAIGFPRAHR